jgi:hypothetical protein
VYLDLRPFSHIYGRGMPPFWKLFSEKVINSRMESSQTSVITYPTVRVNAENAPELLRRSPWSAVSMFSPQLMNYHYLGIQKMR